jgi:nitrite reductase/ring-hydroxylating ferredoxin subunit
MAHHDHASSPAPATDAPVDRRSISLGGAAMAGGLLAGYGMFAWIAARFLYPARDAAKGWLFVTRQQDVAVGASIRYRTPNGATVNITRRAAGDGADAFIALSSTCPHLGCQVHWQGDQNRYFCPCHNGTFDPDGKGTGGPPGDAGQSLPRYALKVEAGLLYIEVPMATLAAADAPAGEVLGPPTGPEGPGHDPCLQPQPGSRSSSSRCV